MRLRYAVTFEFDQAKPETVRGLLDVPNPRLGARRAVEAAQKAKPNMHWRSLVILLDRDEAAAADTADSASLSPVG